MAAAEMPAEHAILGLLALEDNQGEGYGYDLARHFGPGKPLADVLRLEPGMLYHHLKKLTRAGWVEAVLVPQAGRPPRRVHRLTEAGRGELRRWLGAPVARTREIRLEFLVKLYFARRLDPARAPLLLAEQRETCRRLAASLSRQLAAIDTADDPDDAAYRRLVLELRLAQTRAAASWLERAAEGEGGRGEANRAGSGPVATDGTGRA